MPTGLSLRILSHPSVIRYVRPTLICRRGIHRDRFHQLLQKNRQPIIAVMPDNFGRTIAHFFAPIAHRDSQPRIANHHHIVDVVTHGNDFLRLNIPQPRHLKNPLPLIHRWIKRLDNQNITRRAKAVIYDPGAKFAPHFLINRLSPQPRRDDAHPQRMIVRVCRQFVRSLNAGSRRFAPQLRRRIQLEIVGYQIIHTSRTDILKRQRRMPMRFKNAQSSRASCGSISVRWIVLRLPVSTISAPPTKMAAS